MRGMPGSQRRWGALDATAFPDIIFDALETEQLPVFEWAHHFCEAPEREAPEREAAKHGAPKREAGSRLMGGPRFVNIAVGVTRFAFQPYAFRLELLCRHGLSTAPQRPLASRPEIRIRNAGFATENHLHPPGVPASAPPRPWCGPTRSILW